MYKFIKQKKLTFYNKIGLSLIRQIKPLLSGKMERPDNFQFDIMKYVLSKRTSRQLKSRLIVWAMA